MLFNQPPGYQSGPTNKQTLGGLATPGLQSKAITPGSTVHQGSLSSVSTPSSFAPPSFQAQGQQPASMNPYFNSGNGNLSTLLRVLVGNTKR